jgi:hypothetical protein
LCQILASCPFSIFSSRVSAMNFVAGVRSTCHSREQLVGPMATVRMMFTGSIGAVGSVSYGDHSVFRSGASDSLALALLEGRLPTVFLAGVGAVGFPIAESVIRWENPPDLISTVPSIGGLTPGMSRTSTLASPLAGRVILLVESLNSASVTRSALADPPPRFRTVNSATGSPPGAIARNSSLVLSDCSTPGNASAWMETVVRCPPDSRINSPFSGRTSSLFVRTMRVPLCPGLSVNGPSVRSRAEPLTCTIWGSVVLLTTSSAAALTRAPVTGSSRRLFGLVSNAGIALPLSVVTRPGCELNRSSVVRSPG